MYEKICAACFLRANRTDESVFLGLFSYINCLTVYDIQTGTVDIGLKSEHVVDFSVADAFYGSGIVYAYLIYICER